MKELVEYIVKNIVTTPEDVDVVEEDEGGKTLVSITVNPSDMGILIGKAGQTIKAIRKLVIIRAMSENKLVDVTINEPPGTATS